MNQRAAAHQPSLIEKFPVCSTEATAATHNHTTNQAAAIGALRNLAVNDDLQQQLMQCGGVPALLAAAKASCEPPTRTAAVEALRNLAVGSGEACTSIVAAGGVAAMVEAAHALPGGGRLAALGVLLVLSVEEPHKQAVMASGGLRGAAGGGREVGGADSVIAVWRPWILVI
jgi:hypothetical protein